jgi:hypothetical protein
VNPPMQFDVNWRLRLRTNFAGAACETGNPSEREYLGTSGGDDRAHSSTDTYPAQSALAMNSPATMCCDHRSNVYGPEHKCRAGVSPDPEDYSTWRIHSFLQRSSTLSFIFMELIFRCFTESTQSAETNVSTQSLLRPIPQAFPLQQLQRRHRMKVFVDRYLRALL